MSEENVMRKIKSRSFIYDALFVVVIMAAAMASAVLETAAVLGAFPTIDAALMARSTPPASVTQAAAAGSSVDGALLTAAASRFGR